jgi:hypothetical protein
MRAKSSVSSGRIARLDRDAHHFAARRFHLFAADDFALAPIPALHQDVRQQRRDQAPRRRVIENHHPIHRRERGQDPRPLLFGNKRAIRTFHLAHAAVRIHRYHQRVAKRACLFE